MTKFDAKTAVEPLDYTFKPYCDAKGTVPEPTTDQIADFQVKLANQLEEALGEDRVKDVDMADATQVGKLFMSLTAEDHKQMFEGLLNIHAEVCGGQPSADDLRALPFRLRQAFYGALQGWLRPEAERPATSD